MAQAIPFAMSPILTRLYSPDDFGVFAVFIGWVSIISVIVTGRYELAILLPKSERNAFHVVFLSVGLSILVSLVLQVLLLILKNPLIIYLENPKIDEHLPYVPLSTMLIGIYASLNYWCHRKSNYRQLAITKIAQTTSCAAPQVGFGLIKKYSGGLIWGQIVGQIIVVTYQFNRILVEDRDRIKTLCKNRVLALAKKYKNFPRFLILAHGLNTASSQVPIMLLGSLINTGAAGNYILIQRVMGAPMALFANAIGDVFRQEASREFAQNRNCKELYVATFCRLVIFGLPPFVLFYIFAPTIVQTIFGKSWLMAAEYAKMMCPMFFFQFVTSPLSSMFTIAEKQQHDLLWQILLFLSTTSAFLISVFYSSQVNPLKAFSLVYSIMYIINGIMTYKFSSCKIKKI